MIAKVSEIVAKAMSVVFHPIFLPLYILVIYLMANPYQFGYSSPFEDVVFLVQTLFICVMMPLIAVFMMARLNLVSSIHLTQRMDRIGPYIVTAIFYIWYYLNIQNYGVALIFEIFILGSLITLFLCFFINNFFKVSMHSAGIASLIVNLAIANLAFEYGSITWHQGGHFYYLPLAFVLVATLIIGFLVVISRFYLKSHSWLELFGGLLLGVAGQIFALKLVYII
ncbi:hypothetical protein [Membranihabitans marinus]|uniref:hypothetical protein n=1 Tax=Membranihabitans marinus TaxID=1227546 RepID=UPI001F302818|nr:hypothetical protein [Membranihabitans marinus]